MHSWKQKHIDLLKKDYPYCASPRELAKKIGVTYNALKSKVTVLKLYRKVSNANTGKTTSTPKIDRFIKANYLSMPLKRMAVKIGRSDSLVSKRMQQLGLKVPKRIIEKFKKDSRIKKGNVPLNKGKRQVDYMSPEAIERTKATRFHGNPHNTLFDGAITIRHDHPERGGKPHKHIRISLGVWKELQIYNWEKKNGPIPKGYVLACKDGNTLNCKVSNWFLLTMADNARRKAGHKNLSDRYVAGLLAGRKHKHLKEEYLKQPHLIETKRTLIQLKQKIKRHGSKK